MLCSLSYIAYVIYKIFCLLLEPYFTDDFILVTEMRGRRIHQVSLDGRTVQLPIPSLNPMAATYDPYIHKVFWASQGDRRVMSSYLNGTEIRLIKKLTAGKSQEQLSYITMIIVLSLSVVHLYFVHRA